MIQIRGDLLCQGGHRGQTGHERCYENVVLHRSSPFVRNNHLFCLSEGILLLRPALDVLTKAVCCAFISQLKLPMWIPAPFVDRFGSAPAAMGMGSFEGASALAEIGFDLAYGSTTKSGFLHLFGMMGALTTSIVSLSRVTLRACSGPKPLGVMGRRNKLF